MTQQVEVALQRSADLAEISPELLREHPATLSTFRMCCCPPLARERLAGLAGVAKTLVQGLEEGVVPPRMNPEALMRGLAQIVAILTKLRDVDLFPWLHTGGRPAATERHRASTVVADRLCGSTSDPIIRNAQEKRQLEVIGDYLRRKGYAEKSHPTTTPLTRMQRGTYAFRMNVVVGSDIKVKLPLDVVVQPKKVRRTRLPLLIEAKSAGDFTNVNKRRKEEAKKMSQLRETFGRDVQYILFLCGYFNAGYLGYEAAEGMDWIWEHRLTDLDKLGL